MKSIRMRRTAPLTVALATALAVPLSMPAMASEPAPPQRTAPKAAPAPTQAGRPHAVAPADRSALLGRGHAKSTDTAFTTSGDGTGFHLLVADEKNGYAWKTAATLSEPGFEADTWIGNACLTASGKRAAVAYAPRTFTRQDAAGHWGVGCDEQPGQPAVEGATGCRSWRTRSAATTTPTPRTRRTGRTRRRSSAGPPGPSRPCSPPVTCRPATVRPTGPPPTDRTRAKPPIDLFCDASNSCDASKIGDGDSNDQGQGACTLDSGNKDTNAHWLHCWWNKPVEPGRTAAQEPSAATRSTASTPPTRSSRTPTRTRRAAPDGPAGERADRRRRRERCDPGRFGRAELWGGEVRRTRSS
ncbi:hypothetical protein STANM309S_00909 [Streptomyces tanashiensis]